MIPYDLICIVYHTRGRVSGYRYSFRFISNEQTRGHGGKMRKKKMYYVLASGL